MKLLILNGPPDARAAKYSLYRGTYRAHPTYCELLPRDHETNSLFFWFLQEGGELGVVNDLAKARRYTQLLNQHFSSGPKHFELVEVTDETTSPLTGGQLLGFDLSAGYNNSLLWWGLEPQPGLETIPEPIRELVGLVYRCYAPQLNRQGLFLTPEVASKCLSSMDALQQLCPNLFEGEDIKSQYQVVGVYLV